MDVQKVSESIFDGTNDAVTTQLIQKVKETAEMPEKIKLLK